MSSYTADYTPAASPRELATWSDAVITGRIREAVAGRTLELGGSAGGDTYVLIVIDVDQVEVGSIGGAETVYVELPFAGDVRHLSEAVPKDRPIRVFLDRRTEVSTATTLQPDPVPVVYVPTTPQGLMIPDDGGVVLPIEQGQRFADVTLNDLLPDDVYFPPYDPNAPHEE